MFSFFALSARRKPEPAPLPQNPREWGMDLLHPWLEALNHRNPEHRERVEQKLEVLEQAIWHEAKHRFASLEEVFEASPASLPVHLRLYREMHEYMRLWLTL